MKTNLHPAYLLLACLLFAGNSFADVAITDFGSNDFQVAESDFTYSQTASSLTISGNDAGSQAFGGLVTVTGALRTVNLTGADTQLKLSGIYSGAATSDFQIDIFDTNGNDYLYQGNFTDFTPSVQSTVTLSLVSVTDGFNDQANSLQFLTAGPPPGASINLTLNGLAGVGASPVPEPATLATSLLLVSAAGCSILRRRKKQS